MGDVYDMQTDSGVGIHDLIHHIRSLSAKVNEIGTAAKRRHKELTQDIRSLHVEPHNNNAFAEQLRMLTSHIDRAVREKGNLEEENRRLRDRLEVERNAATNYREDAAVLKTQAETLQKSIDRIADNPLVYSNNAMDSEKPDHAKNAGRRVIRQVKDKTEIIFGSGRYFGTMSHGKPEGYGVMIQDDGSDYAGFWKNGHRHGNGTMNWLEGERYTGGWDGGKRSGDGEYIWKDGRRFKGAWLDNKPHGYGELIEPDGTRLYGDWQRGKPMSVMRLTPEQQKLKEQLDEHDKQMKKKNRGRGHHPPGGRQPNNGHNYPAARQVHQVHPPNKPKPQARLIPKSDRDSHAQRN